MTVTALSKKLGISRPIIKRRIESLERELGLKYTLELDSREFGFSNMQVLHLKFSKKPPREALSKIANASILPQLVMMTNGDFDAVIFVIGRNAEERGNWEFELQLELSKYGVHANASYVDIIHHGFVPLTREIIMASTMSETYKRIIMELNENSRVTVKELSNKLSMSADMTDYYIKKIIRNGIIRRFTTLITKPPTKCNILFFATYTFNEGMVGRILKKRTEIYFKKEEDIPIVNEYQLVASISGGEQDLIFGTYPDISEAVQGGVDTHKRIFAKDKPIIKYGTVGEVVKGILPIRNIDIKSNYKTTEWATPKV